jgi:squalene-hopene/tetraprenyl-beta-curcumene cyclase
VSYALPALIAMGIARHRLGPGDPLLRRLRARLAPRALDVLGRLQPDGGGFLEAVPLTSFVCMSLAAAGEAGSPVVRHGLEFLERNVRADGSWPVDTNLATWVTTLSVNALGAGEGLAALGEAERRALCRWLLGQQWRSVHPYTGAAPGGWAWTDLPGGVPDADDTAGALIALAHLGADGADVRAAASAAVQWLLDLQNRDGGIPTFCRGWGTLPFDRSATDLTAHAIRAWTAWSDRVDSSVAARIPAAIERSLAFLASAQREDGAFVPLWFGNQREVHEENPVFGTARALAGLAAAGARGHARAHPLLERGTAWLLGVQHEDGGWGAGPGVQPSIEETATAVTGLASISRIGHGPPVDAPMERGVTWLIRETDGCRRFPASPFGFYFARLWYSEELYPVIFTVGALEAAARASSEAVR